MARLGGSVHSGNPGGGGKMHFYVLGDRDEEDRRVDPHTTGKISVTLSKRNKDVVEGGGGIPFNSLFIPRKCPNGEDTDITWAYYPWADNRLD
jgi:hypothetical protein